MTNPEVFIRESLKFSEETDYREGEMIYRSLRMSLKEPIYRYVRTLTEFEHFVEEPLSSLTVGKQSDRRRPRGGNNFRFAPPSRLINLDNNVEGGLLVLQRHDLRPQLLDHEADFGPLPLQFICNKSHAQPLHRIAWILCAQPTGVWWQLLHNCANLSTSTSPRSEIFR